MIVFSLGPHQRNIMELIEGGEVEVNIPYWLSRLLPMWDYVCPKCKQAVPRKSHTCPHCRENYGTPLRVPPKLLKDKKALSDYVHKVIMPKVSPEMHMYLTNFFTVLFSDGQVGSTMESASDLSAWSGTNGTPTVSADAAYQSSNSVLIHALASGVENCYKNLASAYDTLYMRLYVQFSALPSSGKDGTFALIYDSANNPILYMGYQNNGGTYQLTLVNVPAGYATYTYNYNYTTGVWYCLEFR